MRTSPKIKEAASLPPATRGESSKAAPNFMHTVYSIVRRIPKGRATSYGAIAEASGIRLTARMVGWAMNAAGRAKPPVPAHRVVNSKGILSGKDFFATPTLMQELLEQEGVTVKNDRIENWNEVFWDPAAKTAPRKKTGATKAAGRKKVPLPAKTKAGEKAKPAAKTANPPAKRSSSRPKKGE